MAHTCMQEAELAVSLLYELGEGAPEEALKPDSGALWQLALGASVCALQFLAQRCKELACTGSSHVDESQALCSILFLRLYVRRCVLVAGLMRTDVPACSHRLVALALMETYVRYSRQESFLSTCWETWQGVFTSCQLWVALV
jgi:exportin-T